MTTVQAIQRRLEKLEEDHAMPRSDPSPEQLADAVRQWQALLNEPLPPDPKRDAYWATVTLKQAAADWDATVRGAPPPWL